MTELKDVEEKQKIASEVHELVKRINKILDDAPMFFDIRFTQNNNMMSKNSHLSVFISETVVYI